MRASIRIPQALPVDKAVAALFSPWGSSMKIAISGASGLLGYGLVQTFRSRHTVYALSHQDLEITNGNQVRELLTGLRPDVVVHAAAIRDPDTCELNPAQAFL